MIRTPLAEAVNMVSRFITDWEGQEPLASLAAKWGCSTRHLSDTARRLGLPARPPGRKPGPSRPRIAKPGASATDLRDGQWVRGPGGVLRWEASQAS